MTTRKTNRTPTFGERLIAGLTEAVAIERGEMMPVKVTRRRVTARTATATPAPEYSKTQIRWLRASLKLSQPVLAEALNVSPATLRAWEIGQKRPSGPALRLLEWAMRHPELVLSQVQAR
jgi:DNA-binding transcriptional regulator YiaG